MHARAWEYAAYINSDILMSVEYRWSNLTLCFHGLSVYLCLDRSPSCVTTLWYPFCHIQRLKRILMWQYQVLLSGSSEFSGDLKPYFCSFSCHGYRRQGSWLDATINSALSSLWQICLQTEDLRGSLMLTRTRLLTHIRTNELRVMHTRTYAEQH